MPKRRQRTQFLFKMGNINLDMVTVYKYSGLYFDEFMDFKYGINVLSEAAGRSLSAMIAKMQLLIRNSGFQTFTKMYHSCVAPISDYFAGIWGFNHFDSMNKIQNRACRYYLGLHPKTPISGLQGDMGWLLPKYRHIIALFRAWNRLTQLNTDRIIVFKVLKRDIKMVNG